jgi:uncharacterized protein
MADEVPCWADLAIGDGPVVLAYHPAVLGWTFTEDGAAGHHEAVALADDPSGARFAVLGR